MRFRYKAIAAIEEQDLEDLITNKVSEEKDLEYKRSLPGGRPQDRREFLADASSFANTSGGDLIFGIEEKNGVPIKIVPIQSGNPDADILRLENIIDNGIRPRIIGIAIKEIQIASGGHVIVMRIPRSWNLPHMVWQDRWGKFFSRTSRGKHQLDVDQLRNAFMLSQTAAERIRRFRRERVQHVSEKRTPVPINDGPTLVLHLIPMGAFDIAEQIDIHEIIAKKDKLEPMRLGGSFKSPNFDGYLVWEPEPSDAYTQVFRNGCIEALRVLSVEQDDRIHKGLDGLEIEKLLLDNIASYLQLMSTLGISTPIVTMISILNVERCSIVMRMHRRRFISSESGCGQLLIDKPNLLLQEVLIEEFNPNLEEKLKQSFHAIWNSSGWTGSPYYDDSGKRKQ